MVGGRGWDNDDYLNGLSGNGEALEKAQEDYQEFSQRRKDLLARQEEIMKTPEGRAFLEQQQKQQLKRDLRPRNDSKDDDFKDDFANIEPGSQGGTRMGNMMARAKRMQEQQGGMMGGFEQFEQKFAPLDDDEEDDN
jgi:hypothetical protein